MVEDVKICKELKVEAVVFGILTGENKIDVEKMKFLMGFCEGIDVVFHMAFDAVVDREEGIQQLINLGVKRVLTKGGNFSSAMLGKEKLKELQEKYGGSI